MRIRPHHPFNFVNAHLLQALRDLRRRLSLAHAAMDDQRLSDLAADLHRRVEGRHGLLRYVGDLLTAEAAHLAG